MIVLFVQNGVTCHAGPACEYRDYSGFMDTSLFADYPRDEKVASSTGMKKANFSYPSFADCALPMGKKVTARQPLPNL